MNVLKINNYDLTCEEKLQLKADAAVGATTIVVDGISGLAKDDYLVLEYGNGNGELVKLSATPTTTTVSVGALKYAHKKNVGIIRVPYNQIKLYSATSKTGTYSSVATVDFDADQSFTLYRHSAGTSSTWYKVTFYNSTSLAETAIADATAFKAGVTIDAAPMSPFANSYVNTDMADEYFLDKLDGDKWFGQSDMQKAKLLIEATRRIECFQFYGNSVWNRQKLHFPIWQDQNPASGTATSGTTTTLVSTALATNDDIYDDYYKYGGLKIQDGTNENEVRLVTGYAQATGTVTVDTAFSSAIDSSSTYLMTEAVPSALRDAVCETALWLIDNYNQQGRDPSVKRERLPDGYEVEFFSADESTAVPKTAYALISGLILRMASITVC